MHKSSLFKLISVILVGVIALSTVFIVVFREKYEFPVAANDLDPKDMTSKERIEDFKFLFNVIKENFPFLEVKERTHHINWLELKEYFLDKIKQAESNEEFYLILQEAVTALQNLHTAIVSYPYYTYYKDLYNYYNRTAFTEVLNDPLVEDAQFYWYKISQELQKERRDYDVKIVYSKGEYIVNTGSSANWNEKYKIGVNSTILAINGTPIDEAVQQLYGKTYLWYDHIRNKTYTQILTPDIFGENAVFTIKNHTNNVIVNTSFSTISPLWSYIQAQNNYVSMLNEDCGYIYLSSFSSSYIESDKSMLFSFYEDLSTNDASKLIIDIRDNGGGSTLYWLENILEPLAKSSLTYNYYLAFRNGKYANYFREDRNIDLNVKASETTVTFPPEVYTKKFTDLAYISSTITPSASQSYGFNGDIYLLVGPNVYSAAETFAYVCKETGFATLYGTYTGGDGIGIDPLIFVLPNSKIVVRMSYVMGIKSNGEADEEFSIRPDVLFESVYGDYDSLINYILSL